jgi:hypothetical protein
VEPVQRKIPVNFNNHTSNGLGCGPLEPYFGSYVLFPPSLIGCCRVWLRFKRPLALEVSLCSTEYLDNTLVCGWGYSTQGRKLDYHEVPSVPQTLIQGATIPPPSPNSLVGEVVGDGVLDSDEL